MKNAKIKPPLFDHFARNIQKAIDLLFHSLQRKKGVLVYVGLHRGHSFKALIKKYKKSYGFEANPELFKVLHEEYGHYPGVNIYNVAVADYDGEIDFNISSNDGASSSIGHFDDEFEKASGVKFTQTIRIKCINLYNFLKEEGVNYIDDYVSDIQGMDLEVLKTLKPFIYSKTIGTISCEVTKDERRNIYHDLPSNSESDFKELLKENYVQVAKGWGILKEGNFENTPDHWWEYDSKWRLK